MEWILGLIVLIIQIWAIIQVWQSGTSTGKKLLWTLLILVFPIVGVIIWWFVGPKAGAAHV